MEAYMRILHFAVLAATLGVVHGAHADSFRKRITPIIGVKLASGPFGVFGTTCESPDRLSSVVYKHDFETARNSRPRKDFFALPIRGVFPNSPAEKAGLACGDGIVAVDGKTVRSTEHLQDMVANRPVGAPLVLVISKPSVTFVDDMAVRHYLYTDSKEVVVSSTIPHDQVLPILNKKTINKLEDKTGFGPYFLLEVESTVTELTPEILKYSCVLKNKGEQKRVYLESGLFGFFGTKEQFLILEPGQSHSLVTYGNVAEDGIRYKHIFTRT